MHGPPECALCMGGRVLQKGSRAECAVCMGKVLQKGPRSEALCMGRVLQKGPKVECVHLGVGPAEGPQGGVRTVQGQGPAEGPHCGRSANADLSLAPRSSRLDFCRPPASLGTAFTCASLGAAFTCASLGTPSALGTAFTSAFRAHGKRR